MLSDLWKGFSDPRDIQTYMILYITVHVTIYLSYQLHRRGAGPTDRSSVFHLERDHGTYSHHLCNALSPNIQNLDNFGHSKTTSKHLA